MTVVEEELADAGWAEVTQVVGVGTGLEQEAHPDSFEGGGIDEMVQGR